VILLDNVTKRFGPKILFEGVTMQFDPGKRYGLTGANGAGKSTLLKMLGSDEETDVGSITIPGSMRLGVLRQNHFEYDAQRIIDAVIMGKRALWEAMKEKDTLLAKENISDEDGIRLGELEGVVAEEDGYTAEGDAGALLTGLGIPAHKHEDRMDTLASGYKLRVLLAQVLYGKPDVLLLDEPTNHLDLESIHWLESFLLNYRGLVVTVSHDRHFLNEIATHIADVDYQTITTYTGNYNDFVDAKYENRQKAEAQNASAKKKIADLQNFVDRFGSHASKSKQAQSRVKMIEKLEVKDLKRSSLIRPYVRFEFEKPSGRDLLRMTDISKSFKQDDGSTLNVFQKGSLHVSRGDRVAVIGPNGAGKSTLLKLMVGAYAELDAFTKEGTLNPDAGEVRWGHDTSVGYFAQDHHEALGRRAAGMNAFQWLYTFDKDRPQEEVLR
jgi:ATPase subunit of ABC transporter with duplicated ATPase domains